MTDAIIEELWRIKDAIAREYGDDVDAFVAHLRAQGLSPGQRVVDLRATRTADKAMHPTRIRTRAGVRL